MKRKIKKIDLASTKQIDRFVLPNLKERATNIIFHRFVKVVLECSFECLLLTDESTLSDFTPVKGRDEKAMVKKIFDEYGVDVSKLKKKYIWKILERICRKLWAIDGVLEHYPQLTQEYLDTGKISDKSIISIGPKLFKNEQEVDELLGCIGGR